MDKLSFLDNIDPGMLDDMYQDYRNNPDSVEAGWRKFFEGFDLALQRHGGEVSDGVDFSSEIKVLNLIDGYRTRGHLFTKTNPVRTRREYTPTLDIENFGLSREDLDRVYHAGAEINLGPVPLRDIIEHLEETYCHSIGCEFRYIRSPEEREWLQKRMETTRNRPRFGLGEKRHILFHLNKAVVFEQFLHSRFPGQKRFSLEGAETLIPALDAVIEKGAETGIEEFVIGMAHRGRLNVLTNILHKKYSQVFTEFGSDAYSGEEIFHGDVKYHLGYTSEIFTHNRMKIKIRLAANPSHLEAVNPVVEGLVRVKLDRSYNGDMKKIAPILIHGDSAIAGQGVNYEVIQMSLLEGYKTGGTIHLVINNQIGFTTNYLDARSSTYCTDVGKVTLSPVFHVNADDVEAVLYTVQLALEFRQRFHRDVFVDLLGYRKHGHNEGDEPRYTQPLLYKIISKHPNPRDIYAEKLIKEGVVRPEDVKEMEKKFVQHLEKELQIARKSPEVDLDSYFQNKWKGYHIPAESDFETSPPTGVGAEELRKIGERIFTIPEEFHSFKKIKKIFEQRLERFRSGKNFDWGMGELLAYGTLLEEGISVRLSGQDVERGTFSHRHAVVTDEETEEEYIPLNHISENQAGFQVFNSLLSEYAVLGFEFGYSLGDPKILTIWEAQFGDFSNGAQVIIDQFLSCSTTKWQRMSGLTLFLPHGYEGQGPEHSSARPERFLQLCADLNMQVVNPTTPANLFHLLRRQIHRKIRLPLVVLTPKSLLRHPRCTSDLKEFEDGGFREVIDDNYVAPRSVKRVLFCSGKIYYDLWKIQQEDKRKDVALVRLEQIYPFPLAKIEKIIKRYKNADEWFWVQEEPENMGAWHFVRDYFGQVLNIRKLSRPASSVPATGYILQHRKEQEKLITGAFADNIN